MKKNWILFKTYFLVGAFTFSGGIAMLPAIEKYLCKKYRLLEKETLYEYAALAQTVPGVIALTNACLVGKKIGGTPGMLFAGLGAILPAYIFMTLATILYTMIPREGPIFSALIAVRATTAAFLFAAAYTISRQSLKNLGAIIVAAACFILTVFNLIDVPYLIVIAAFLGVITVHFKKLRRNKQQK